MHACTHSTTRAHPPLTKQTKTTRKRIKIKKKWRRRKRKVCTIALQGHSLAPTFTSHSRCWSQGYLGQKLPSVTCGHWHISTHPRTHSPTPHARVRVRPTNTFPARIPIPTLLFTPLAFCAPIVTPCRASVHAHTRHTRSRSSLSPP